MASGIYITAINHSVTSMHTTFRKRPTASAFMSSGAHHELTEFPCDGRMMIRQASTGTDVMMMLRTARTC